MGTPLPHDLTQLGLPGLHRDNSHQSRQGDVQLERPPGCRPHRDSFLLHAGPSGLRGQSIGHITWEGQGEWGQWDSQCPPEICIRLVKCQSGSQSALIRPVPGNQSLIPPTLTVYPPSCACPTFAHIPIIFRRIPASGYTQVEEMKWNLNIIK